jgi:hypothetical protein
MLRRGWIGLWLILSGVLIFQLQGDKWGPREL